MAVMAKTHTHFLQSENPFFDFYQIFTFCASTPMCGSFGMISVVVHFILWLIIMWLVNHFMGVQMHFSIA